VSSILVPVRSKGRMEWAVNGPFVYGITPDGEVLRFENELVPRDARSARFHFGTTLSRFRAWLASL